MIAHTPFLRQLCRVALLCLLAAPAAWSATAPRLYDKFNTPAHWRLVNHGGTASVRRGQLVLSVPANTLARPYAETLNEYSLVRTRHSVEVPSHTGSAAKSVFFFSALTSTTGKSLEMKVDDTAKGAVLVCGYYVGGAYTYLGSAAYNPMVHRYLALRESGGRITFESSADALTWRVVASSMNPFGDTPLNVKFRLEHKVYATGVRKETRTVLDNWNYRAKGSRTHLDNAPLANWLLYTEPFGNGILVNAFQLIDPTLPFGDANVFQFQIEGSQPYTNAYLYQNLPQVPNVDFVYSVDWKFSSTNGAVAEAYEFPFSKYTGGQRLEAAMQYLPSSDGGGYRWRVWGGPNAGYWRDNHSQTGASYEFVQKLSPGVWHRFRLHATLKNGRVYYRKLVSNGATFIIDENFPAVADPYNTERLVVAYQIDNNYFGNQQNVYLANFHLSWRETALR